MPIAPSRSFKSALTACLLAMVAGLTGVDQAIAANTEWQTALGGKVRLIAGGLLEGKAKVGLEISMEEGWKTYWKVPGDAGIPPLFDFSASENVKNVEIKWPVPTRFGTDAQMLGYKDAIIFPLLVSPEDPARPMMLKASIQLGLCSELCVPMAGDFNLPIAAEGEQDSLSEMLIDRDLALAPLTERKGFELLSVKKEVRDGQPDRLLFAARIPDGYGRKDLFAEPPVDWLTPLTQALPAEKDGILNFELVLDGLPKHNQTKDARLAITLTNGEEAIEEVINLAQ